MRAHGDNYGAVIDGARRDCSAVPSASRRPRLSAYPRQPPEKARPHNPRVLGHVAHDYGRLTRTTGDSTLI